jgi:hypothetical protein
MIRTPLNRRRGAFHGTRMSSESTCLQVLWIATSYLLLSISAFQSDTAFERSLAPPQWCSRLPVLMAESTYKPNQSDRGSFLIPMFQQERSRRGNVFSRNSLNSGSSTRPFSMISRDYDDNDDERRILSYLPDGGARLTPKTKGLLQRITRQYVYGYTKDNYSPVTLVELAAAIADEYKSYDLPVEINGTMLSVRESNVESDRVAAQILSFAALNCLPKEITLLLLAIGGEEETQKYRLAFAAGGWSKVAFPRGLPIRRRRRCANQSIERYFPVPRSWATSRKQKTNLAEKLLYEASLTPAPIRLLQTPEAFLLSMTQILAKTKASSKQTFRDALQVFPRRRKQVWKSITEFSRKQADRLKSSGRAGIVANSFINFAWYTVAIISQWRRLIGSVPCCSQSAFLAASLRHFARSIAAAFVGAQFMKLPRIMSATAIAPLGKWALKSTQKRLRVSEDRAVVTLKSAMMAIFILVSTTLISADAIITRILRSMFH